MSRHNTSKRSQALIKQHNKAGLAPQAPKAGQHGQN